MYSDVDETILRKNLKGLSDSNPSLGEKISQAVLDSRAAENASDAVSTSAPASNVPSTLTSSSSFEIKTSKTGLPVLVADGIALHSLMDPITESKRLLDGLKKEDEERVFLFFGAGLGYVVQETLKFKNVTAVWMEADPEILRYALSLFDYSELLESGKLKILLTPLLEQDLYAALRGISGFPISFIPHRGSNQRV